MPSKPHMCTTCNEINPESFRKGKKSKCKSCEKLYNKEYRKKNKKKLSKKYKIWSENNKDRKKELYDSWISENREKKSQKDKEWRESNKNHIKDYRNQYNKKRKNQDTSYRIICNIRSRQWQVLKGKMSITQNLGCNTAKLKYHLEGLFDSNMTWENYGFGEGCWNIDHIIPLSKFHKNEYGEWDESSKFNKSLIHYTNLQPLWQKDNFEKSDNLNYELKTSRRSSV